MITINENRRHLVEVLKSLTIVLSLALILQYFPPASRDKVEASPKPIPFYTVTEQLEPIQAIELQKIDKVATKAVEVPQASPVKSTGSNCEEWMRQAGIPLTNSTRKLILNESGCRTTAVNPSSGACGIAQAYPCSKMKCPLNDSGAVCQLKWMDTYIKGRYGSWDNALSMWYSRCGSPQGCWY